MSQQHIQVCQRCRKERVRRLHKREFMDLHSKYCIYPDSVFLCIVNERVKGKEHESN